MATLKTLSLESSTTVTTLTALTKQTRLFPSAGDLEAALLRALGLSVLVALLGPLPAQLRVLGAAELPPWVQRALVVQVETPHGSLAL
jgi:hypothetical protein